MAPHPRVAAHAAAFLAALQLAATLSPAAAAGTASATGHGAATAGNAGSGAAVQAALDAAISKGASSFSLPAGDVSAAAPAASDAPAVTPPCALPAVRAGTRSPHWAAARGRRSELPSPPLLETSCGLARLSWQ